MTEQPPPQPDHRLGLVEGAANIVKGLSLQNVLIIALLALIAVPTYIIYRALGDDALMDRFMSTYEEVANQNVPCALRHVQARGGRDEWSVSAGFSFVGNDRWFVNVVMNHQPSTEEIVSYCETLKLIADKMLERGRSLVPDDQSGGSEVHP